MKMAARKPAMSVTMPPPKAITRLDAVAAAPHHLFGQLFERRQPLLLFAARQEQHFVRRWPRSPRARRAPWCRHTSSVEITNTLPAFAGTYRAARLPRSTTRHTSGVSEGGHMPL